jgi:hypothetical protein
MKVARDTRPAPSDDELNRAVSILTRPDADQGAVDAAFETLASVAPAPGPSRGFARRVTLAVRQAPLAEGRRPLARLLPDWFRVTARAAAAATVSWGALAVLGPFGAYAVARVVEFLVRAGLSILVSLNTLLRVGRAVVTVAAALAGAIASPPMTTVLTMTALVSGLGLIALIRLLSTEQESSPWPNRSSSV